MVRLIYILLFGGLLATFLGSLEPVHANPKTEVLQNFTRWLTQTRERKDLLEAEKDLRLEVIHRLKFEFQQKYSGDQNLRDFFVLAVNNILLTDRMPENRSLSRLIPYLENLQDALKKMLEPREDALQFAKTFTEYSSVSEPLAVNDFGRTRDYSNGSIVLEAAPLSASDAAEIAEQILNSHLPDKPLLYDQNLILDYDLSGHTESLPSRKL
jgi:hypothetical protein